MEKLDYIPTTGWNVEWSGALKKFRSLSKLNSYQMTQQFHSQVYS